MSDLKEILEHLELADILDNEGQDYKETRGSSGVQLQIKTCPFCGHSSYKVYANAVTGLGNCFSGSCETKFNIYSFTKALLGRANHFEVMDYLQRLSMNRGWRPKRMALVATEPSKDFDLPESIALPHNGKNLKYLANRNISHEITQYFRLRYCEEGFYSFKGANDEDRKQKYRKRIIIPIYDLEGNLVSFQGRDITGTSDRKYLFPPGRASTGKFLYNGMNAIRAKHIVLNEGVFDVFATKMALDDAVYMRGIVPVATFGKHLSEDQVGELLKLKKMGLQEITFMWDSEPEAIKAAISHSLKLSGLGFKTKVALLPDGKDPNEVEPKEVRFAMEFATPMNRANATKMLLGIR